QARDDPGVDLIHRVRGERVREQRDRLHALPADAERVQAGAAKRNGHGGIASERVVAPHAGERPRVRVLAAAEMAEEQREGEPGAAHHHADHAEPDRVRPHRTRTVAPPATRRAGPCAAQSASANASDNRSAGSRPGARSAATIPAADSAAPTQSAQPKRSKNACGDEYTAWCVNT